MFSFHMNSFDAVMENKADFFIIKRKDITKNITKSDDQNKKRKLSMFLEIKHQRNPFKNLKRAHQRKLKVREWNYFTAFYQRYLCFYINKHCENSKAQGSLPSFL